MKQKIDDTTEDQQGDHREPHQNMVKRHKAHSRQPQQPNGMPPSALVEAYRLKPDRRQPPSIAVEAYRLKPGRCQELLARRKHVRHQPQIAVLAEHSKFQLHPAELQRQVVLQRHLQPPQPPQQRRQQPPQPPQRQVD